MNVAESTDASENVAAQVMLVGPAPLAPTAVTRPVATDPLMPWEATVATDVLEDDHDTDDSDAPDGTRAVQLSR